MLVPPPRSQIRMVLFSWPVFMPKAIAAAVGSEISLTFSNPASLAAFSVSNFCFVSKYAGCVITASFISSPPQKDQNLDYYFIIIKIIDILWHTLLISLVIQPILLQEQLVVTDRFLLFLSLLFPKMKRNRNLRRGFLWQIKLLKN